MSDATVHRDLDGAGLPLHLSDRLKTARHDRGLSQAQAARELDVARTAYRLWEMAAALPAPRRWRAVAAWLGVTVTTLLLGEDLLPAHEAPGAGEVDQTRPATVGGA